jgi:hypothetical protein
MRRTLVLSVSLIIGAIFASARPASAAFIGLTAPVTGTSQPGDVIDLTVSFDPNGSPAANLVSSELYVAFTGLVPVAGSYQLGSMFTPVASDVLALDGLCGDPFCGYVTNDPPPNTYQSLIALFSPSVVIGPGTLFTMQFTLAPGATDWSLNLFGDDEFGLYADPPPPVGCAADDPECDPVMASIPFGIFLNEAIVESGLARVNLDVNAPSTDPPPVAAVPEPASLVLVGTGVLILTTRRRRRR